MDLGPLGGDCVKGFIVTFVKNHKDLYMQRIESIDTFYKNHNLSLIEKRVVNGKEIYDFSVNDEIYINSFSSGRFISVDAVSGTIVTNTIIPSPSAPWDVLVYTPTNTIYISDTSTSTPGKLLEICGSV
jgi:hypothetical protein